MIKDYEHPNGDMATLDRALVGAFLPNHVGRIDHCNFGSHSMDCIRSERATNEWLDNYAEEVKHEAQV